jgi:hypothetical protein
MTIISRKRLINSHTVPHARRALNFKFQFTFQKPHERTRNWNSHLTNKACSAAPFWAIVTINGSTVPAYLATLAKAIEWLLLLENNRVGVQQTSWRNRAMTFTKCRRKRAAERRGKNVPPASESGMSWEREWPRVKLWNSLVARLHCNDAAADSL